MTAKDVRAEFSPPPDDPLRHASPVADDVEARRAKAAVEAGLFGSTTAVVRVGRYVISGKIGAGGMGVVYRAHDPELARDVAVKLLNPDAARGTEAETAQARLVREARAMARLAHPNVIHVYDVGTVTEGVFIAMELVEGEDLGSWLEIAPRAWPEVLRKCIDAGRGLAAAHAAEVVHRDFKPENVLVGKDGRVRVVDFGLAGGSAALAPLREPTPRPAEIDRVVAGAADGAIAPALTRTGAMLGTPKYMAPEQYEGATTSARSDQFSFCVTVYEALYGRAPFDGRTVHAYQKSVRSGRIVPPPPTSKVPRWIFEELARGLAVDPDDRHDGMEPLLDRLREALAEQRVIPRRTGRVVGAAAGLVVLVGTSVAIGMAVARSKPAELAPEDAPSHTPAPTVLHRPVEPPAQKMPNDVAPADDWMATPIETAKPSEPNKAESRTEGSRVKLGDCHYDETNDKLIAGLHRHSKKPKAIGDDCWVCDDEYSDPRGLVRYGECKDYWRCHKVDRSECGD